MKYFIYVIFTFYFFSLFQVFSLGTLGVTPVYIALFGLYAYILIRFIFNSQQFEINFNSSFFILLLFALSSFICSTDPILSGSSARLTQYLKTTAHFNYLILFTVLCGTISLNKSVWLNAIKIWLILSIFINIFGVYQIAARAYDLPFAWLEITNVSIAGRQSFADTEVGQLSLKFKNFYRATSIFAEPSALATFNLIILSMLFFAKLSSGYDVIKSKFLYILIFVSSLIAMFLTFSLTGAFGIFLLIMFYVFTSRNVNYSRLIFIFFTAIILIVIADYFVVEYFNISVVDLFYNRITNILGLSRQGMSGESFFTRFSNINDSIDAWLLNPFFGAGMGQTYIVADFTFSEFGIFQVLIEMGIIGAIFFILLYLFTFIELLAFNNTQLNKETKYLISVSLYIWVILFIINFITSNNIVAYSTWIFFGLIFSILKIARKELGVEYRNLRMWEGFKIKKPHFISRAQSN